MFCKLTNQEKGITSAIKEINIEMILRSKHIMHNTSKNIKNQKKCESIRMCNTLKNEDTVITKNITFESLLGVMHLRSVNLTLPHFWNQIVKLFVQ